MKQFTRNFGKNFVSQGLAIYMEAGTSKLLFTSAKIVWCKLSELICKDCYSQSVAGCASYNVEILLDTSGC